MATSRTSRTELILLSSAALLFLAGAVTAFALRNSTNHAALAGVELLRWVGVLLLGVFALRRRSITPWIFVAMIAGAEIGFDAPAFAVHLRVFSDIFLRLIKTIVAPLILVTLITGIAGHGDLKGVGRMGVRSLIYFEAVTTLALVLGLIAINLTHAGAGLTLPAAPHTEAIAAPAALHWDDFLLHIFPRKYRQVHCRGPDPPGRRLRSLLRDCSGDPSPTQSAPRFSASRNRSPR